MTDYLEFGSFSDVELVEYLHDDHNIVLKHIYQKNKDACLMFMKKYAHNFNQDYLFDDIYHDAVLAFYEKAKSRTFILTASLKTYLISICRNQILANSKYNQHFSIPPIIISEEVEDEAENLSWEDTITTKLETVDNETDEKVNFIVKALDIMRKNGGKCYELLSLFYYHDKSMNEIASELGYTNSKNAKNQKFKCLERLRQMTISMQ